MTRQAQVPMSAAELSEELQLSRAAVVDHPLYDRLAEPGALAVFCSHHTFAVWDFMALITALQVRLTCVTQPWVPPPWPTEIVRLVNEIKLDEESDEHPDGGAVSHFDLYRAAMLELGFPTATVDRAVALAASGVEPGQACALAGAPQSVVEFVGATTWAARHEQLAVTAAAFAFGRETLIPAMFARVPELAAGRGRLFRVYLERHGALDADEHGPAALAVVDAVCGTNPRRWALALEGAQTALAARAALWDGVLEAL
jgi:hypothetical protein